MGIRISGTSTETYEYPYVSERLGIAESAGAVLIFRPPTAAENEEWIERGVKLVKTVSRPVRGKRGVPDHTEQYQQTDYAEMRRLTRERVREFLVGWRGFEDEAGAEIAYSWDAFTTACNKYDDLLSAADRGIEDAYTESIKRLNAHSKN